MTTTRNIVFAEGTFADGDATPSVASQKTLYKVANSSATTITDLDDAVTGQSVKLLFTDSNTTLDGGLTKTGMDIPTQDGDTWEGIYTGTEWQQVGGSIGMGRFVPVEPPDAIGDWPTTTTTSPATVDLSDDGVRKGASEAVILWKIDYASGDYGTVRVRPYGSSATGTEQQRAYGSDAWRQFAFPVPLGNDAKFDAWFGTSKTSNTNVAYVLGYYI